ncbi:MAG: HDOD domain-containing protein [Pseudomonadota bacterium]|nr:HDOD domain-containing protein [Pseudomonadota bacterium]
MDLIESGTRSAPNAISSSEITAAARMLGSAGGGTGAAKLLSLMYDENVTAQEILRCVRTQPTLAARVLKVANSAYYRCSGKVGTLERAVVLLGLPAIRGIAATACMDRLPLPSARIVIDPQRLRQHSLAVALAAQSFSQRTGAGVDAEAFMAGLLHDVGIVMLAWLRPEAVATLSRLPAIHPSTVVEKELDLIGTDHASAAAQLVQVWGLPSWLGQALQSHHVIDDPVRWSGIEALPAILILADRCAQDAGFGVWATEAVALDAAWSKSLGLDQQIYDEVVRGLAVSLTGLTAGLTA